MIFKSIPRLITLIFFLFLTSNAFAQTFGSIQGKVIDAKTKEPLPFVTVFLAQTSIGTASMEDGSFKLEKIPAGKYNLNISMVGYSKFSKSIEFTGHPIENFLVQLNEVSQELEAVTVSAHREKRTASAYAKFEGVFLGQTGNALHCKILNKNDVFAYYKNQKLVAYANKPIVILNNALGYKVFYNLKEFEADFTLMKLTMLGEIRFEELAPANGKQKAKWMKERDRAYYGSDVHFLRSLISRKLTENYYIVQGPDGKFLKEDDLIVNGMIKFNGKLNVNFSKEISETRTVGRGQEKIPGQQSEVILNGTPIKVYENGYFEDFHNIVFLGQFQIGGIADLVPLGYTPSKGL